MTASPIQLEPTISELLLLTKDFLDEPHAAAINQEDPLLYSIVAGFLSILSIYDDYKKTKSQEPFPFMKEMPNG